MKKDESSSKKEICSTDGKVKTFSTTEDDINVKLSEIIGQKFVKYREQWDLANKMSNSSIEEQT